MKLATRIFRRSDWYVTSPFGPRTPINTSAGTTKSFHNGCDYGTHGSKWAQYALEDGVVESAGRDSSGGIFAWVKYPRLGFRLLHYHLDSVKVRTGQTVNKDTVIGYTGTTGMSTGIHLHLGKRAIGSSAYVNPHTYDYVEAITPAPSPAPSNYFGKGTRVVLNGRLYRNSAGEGAGAYVTNRITNITRVAEGTKCPYNTTGDLGWMEASAVTLYTEPVDNSIKVGDIVVPISLRSYSGVRLVQYDKNYVVTEISGNRAVLKANRNGKLITWAAMNINNIRRV